MTKIKEMRPKCEVRGTRRFYGQGGPEDSAYGE